MGTKYSKDDPDYIPKDITARERPERGGTNYGVVSMVVFILAGVAGYWGYYLLTEIECDWTKMGENLQLATMGFYAMALCWLVSIAIAGAGLATNRGSFLALLVLALDFLPLLMIGYFLVTGSTPDFMDTSRQSTPDGMAELTADQVEKCL